jgi:Winged helix-turn helix
MAAPKAVRIELSEFEVSDLGSRLRRRKVVRADAIRAEIVLLAAQGVSNLAIAERLGITRVRAATWRRRFAEKRLDGLHHEQRPGAPRTVTDEKIAEVLTATLEALPAGRTHWSSRGMARASGWRHRRCSASGKRSLCRRIAAKPSSCPPIHYSSTKCATS